MEGIDYIYRAADPEHSHAYLYPSVQALTRDFLPGTKVLDLGCGNGSFLSLFRGRGWELHGTDFSPTGIAIGRQFSPEIDFFLADASAAIQATADRLGPLDLVLSTEVVEHLYDPRAFLRNALVLLKPGGSLILSTPYHGYLKNLVLAVTGQMDKHFTVLWDHGHIKFWSRNTLEQALRECGFEDIRFSGSGRLPFLWKSMLLRATKPR